MTQEITLIIIGAAAGAAIIWFLLKKKSPTVDTTLHDRLDRIMQQVDTRLSENVRAMNESKSFLADRVSAAERSVRAVSTGLGQLNAATTAIQRANEEIISFQNMLKSPKIRGSFGEVLLGNLLADVLPSDRYELQHTFGSSGEVADAVIRLQDGYIVTVDAKFPLANYQLMQAEQDPARKVTQRKTFLRDVKKHIQDIARKYVVPQERTLDYAFMYIPVETVYYEMMVHETEEEAASREDPASLWEFCLAHKIVPVSPNSFLAYLHTVLIGLRGLKIEKQAKEILEHLGQLRVDFGQFAKDYAMIGTHLTNAKNRYDDSARRLDKFTNRLEQIDTSTSAKLPGQSPE
ncbi:MAG: DNA recombination protein RmuC [Patescibacteria group bacterium]